MAPRSLWTVLLAVSCSHHPAPTAGTSNDAGAPQKAIDRLLPDELGQSKLLVFGFPVPQGMNVERRYAESVHLVGTVSPTVLTAYVRAHAATGPAELMGSRKVFSKVRIRGGDPNRIYDIEIDDSGAARRLIVSDVTPPPLEPGLSDEERWKRAGYNADGTPIANAEPR
jgi:hypothetical protein